MKSFVVLVFFVLACGNYEFEPDCIGSFLKNETIRSEVCEKEIKKHVSDFKKIFKNSNYNETEQNCIYNVLDEYKIINVYFKGMLHHYVNKTDQHEYDYYLKKSRNNFIRLAALLCTDPKVTSFDEPKYSQLASKRNSHENMCKQKYLMEQNILNPAEYNIDISSLKTIIDCKTVTKKLDAYWDFFNAITFYGFGVKEVENVKKCSYDKLFPEKFFLYKEFYTVIATLELSKEQRIELRMKAINWFRSMARLDMSCYQTIL